MEANKIVISKFGAYLWVNAYLITLDRVSLFNDIKNTPIKLQYVGFNSRQPNVKYYNLITSNN